MTDESLPSTRLSTKRSLFITLGVVLFVILVAGFKSLAEEHQWLSVAPVSTRLEALREQGRPVVVFFHSPACSSCKQVQQTLAAVYPAYRETVFLLDVDTTDTRERELVERTGVQITPTLLLVNASGAEKLLVGEISTADLRAELDALAGGVP